MKQMEYLRDKHLQELMEQSNTVVDETNAQKHDEVVRQLCSGLVQHVDQVKLSDTVLDELKLCDWIREYPAMRGGKECIINIVNKPTYNTDILLSRGEVVKSLPECQTDMKQIANNEQAVLWLLGMPTSLQDAYPLPLLFPCWPVIRRLNYVPMFVFALYIFKAYISPLLNVSYPLTSILGPYYYIRRYLKINMSFSYYMSFLKTAFVLMMKPSGNIKQDAFKYVTVIVYLVLYVYTIFHGFEVAAMVRKLRHDLVSKWERIHNFILSAKSIDLRIPDAMLEPFTGKVEPTRIDQLYHLDQTMSSMYKLLTCEMLRGELQRLLQKVYLVDAISGCKSLLMSRGWTLSTFGEVTKIWAMGHPLLGDSQIRNPISMTHNIIITGPNAAGKTTYMKAVCANMILSQTIGICCSYKCIINPVHSILSSMNISDSVGKESLFEAEVRRCSLLVKEAQHLSKQGKRALFFLDEPMHSTPPTEGTATAMAVAEFLGKMPGIFVFLTTHYHHVTQLEKMYPEHWINVSMEAHPTEGGNFAFPYVLKKGASYQCIAIELLKERSLPSEIIHTAIEMKNKICNDVLENDI